MLPVCRGSISYDVVTALTYCKSVRISIFFSVYMWFGLICLMPMGLENTRQVRFPAFVQSASLWLHPSILFIRVDLQNAPDVCWIKAEAAAEDRMPSTMRSFVSYLLGAMTVFCLACRLGLCTAVFMSGYRTLCSFHILYDVYTSVYRHLLPSSLWILFFFFILFCISPGLPSLAGWCCLHINVCVVGVFFTQSAL